MESTYHTRYAMGSLLGYPLRHPPGAYHDIPEEESHGKLGVPMRLFFSIASTTGMPMG